MVFVLATLVLPLLVARCIAAMGSEDSRIMTFGAACASREEGHGGINEQTIAVLRAIVARWPATSNRSALTRICLAT